MRNFLLGTLCFLATHSKALVLSDQLISPVLFASQGAVLNSYKYDALAWVQNPAHLSKDAGTNVSSGSFLVYPDLSPRPAEKSARGAIYLGYEAPLWQGALGIAIAMPVGQNVWVDTGTRESSALFALSRISSFSLSLGWAKEFSEGLSLGLEIPVLFKSSTRTDIYLTAKDPWARAQSGVRPYFGWHLGLKKDVGTHGVLGLSYKHEQSSKIEFGVSGEVDFAELTVPLEAVGSSQILFDPRRVMLSYQHDVESWSYGIYLRWSNWQSAPPHGLVIDSNIIPNVQTQASTVNWMDQWELSLGAAKKISQRLSVLASYRIKTRVLSYSNDYFDYNQDIFGFGTHYSFLDGSLWLNTALRIHYLRGGGRLYSVLSGLDWHI